MSTIAPIVPTVKIAAAAKTPKMKLRIIGASSFVVPIRGVVQPKYLLTVRSRDELGHQRQPRLIYGEPTQQVRDRLNGGDNLRGQPAAQVLGACLTVGRDAVWISIDDVHPGELLAVEFGCINGASLFGGWAWSAHATPEESEGGSTPQSQGFSVSSSAGGVLLDVNNFFYVGAAYSADFRSEIADPGFQGVIGLPTNWLGSKK
jgi:hypothetical protein